MPNSNNKVANLFTRNIGKLGLALLFFLCVITYSYASVFDVKTNSLSLNNNVIVAGKIYVTRGTIISGFDDKSSAEVIRIKEKTITKKSSVKKVIAKKKKARPKKKVEDKDKKEKITYFNSTDKQSSSFFYTSSSKIMVVLSATSGASKKKLLYTVITNQIFASAYLNSQKLRVPSFISAEVSQFQTSAYAVRPPPQKWKLTTISKISSPISEGLV